MWPLSLCLETFVTGLCRLPHLHSALHPESPEWFVWEFPASVASQNLLGNALARKRAHKALQVQLCSFSFPNVASSQLKLPLRGG